MRETNAVIQSEFGLAESSLGDSWVGLVKYLIVSQNRKIDNYPALQTGNDFYSLTLYRLVYMSR